MVFSHHFLKLSHIYTCLLELSWQVFRVTHSCTFVSYYNFPLFFPDYTENVLVDSKGLLPTSLRRIKSKNDCQSAFTRFLPSLIVPSAYFIYCVVFL